jgi:hypothetical protein
MLAFSSSTDVGPALAFIGVGLLVLGAVAGVTIWRGRRRGSTTLVMDVALTLSGWWVSLGLLGLVINVVNIIAGNGGFEVGASVSMPWPAGVPCDRTWEGEDPALFCGSGSLSSAYVLHSSVGIRLLVALSQVCTTALALVPAVLIGVVCFLTLRGRPFAQTIVRALYAGSITVLVLGIAAGVLPEISGVLALREAVPQDSGLYPMTFQLGLSLPAIGGALGLAVLAAVFREGSQLQQETERLQKDTEGLV